MVSTSTRSQTRRRRRGYRRAPKGFDTSGVVLHRDAPGQSGRQGSTATSSRPHKVFRAQGGSDEPSNLVALATCHDDLHAGKFNLKVKRSKTRHATEVGSSRVPSRGRDGRSRRRRLRDQWKREQCLGWPKSHAADAVAICCEDGEVVTPNPRSSASGTSRRATTSRLAVSEASSESPPGSCSACGSSIRRDAEWWGFVKGSDRRHSQSPASMAPKQQCRAAFGPLVLVQLARRAEAWVWWGVGGSGWGSS